MTLEEFEAKFGKSTDPADLDRVNCTQGGTCGHSQCGLTQGECMSKPEPAGIVIYPVFKPRAKEPEQVPAAPATVKAPAPVALRICVAAASVGVPCALSETARSIMLALLLLVLCVAGAGLAICAIGISCHALYYFLTWLLTGKLPEPEPDDDGEDDKF